jgi:hypothetical protein
MASFPLDSHQEMPVWCKPMWDKTLKLLPL